MAIPGMMIEEMPVPSMADGLKNVSSKDLDGYSIKYIKADMDDLAAVADLQRVETLGLRGDSIILLNRDKYTFLERYFIVLQYMERNT
jgi:hypothetical protein